MKTRFLFMLVATFLPLFACAQTVRKSIDGIEYILNSSDGVNTATVVGTICSGDIIIPESVTFEEVTYSVTSIGRQAFMTFSNLTSVTIPNSVTSIGESAFSECSGLTSLTIPNSVTSIGNYAFYGCFGLASVTIPNSVTWIGFEAFYGCSSLTSIEIPNSVTNISNAFSGCSGLTSVTIPNSVTSIGESAFDGCLSLRSVTIPNSVASIGYAAFESCRSLTSIEIPNSVTSIGKFAFSGCSGLTSVTIPNSVTSIGSEAFEGCSLKEVLCYSNNVHLFDLCFGTDDISSITLYVSDYAIESFKALNMGFKDIVVFDKVTDFNLTYLINGEEYKKEQHKYDDEITPLEEPVRDGYTFSGWSEIPEKMPGKDVKVEGTFIRNEVKENGVIYHVFTERAVVVESDNATGEVKIASSVTFNENDVPVTDIIIHVFRNNTNITSVEIPDNVRMIGSEAFYGCKNLKTISMGKKMALICDRAFAGIDNLTDITIYAEEVPETDRTAFENSYTEDYVTLHVPAGSLEKYKAAAPWKNFKEIVAIPDADADDTDVDVITIKSYGKGTYCSDYDLDFSDTENLKAFIVSGYDHKTNTIWLTRVKSVPAGTGIIVKGIPGDYRVKHVESLSVYANFLVGTTEDKKIKDVEGEMTNFVLSKGEWYRFDGEITLPKGMAYLPLPLSKFAGTRSLTEVYEDNDEGTTEIRTIEQGTVSGEHDVWFNLQGQRVDKPRKGLYIRNGKKIVVR